MSNIDRMLIGKLDNNCDLLSSVKNNFRYVGEVKMSDRKLDFKTWCDDIGIRECVLETKCDDCRASWNFCQAQEKKEAQAKQAMYDLESAKLKRDIDDLKKKLSEAVEVIRFYADKTNWLGYHREVDTIMCDSEEEFAESDGFKISLGGKRARAFLKGDKYE